MFKSTEVRAGSVWERAPAAVAKITTEMKPWVSLSLLLHSVFQANDSILSCNNHANHYHFHAEVKQGG